MISNSLNINFFVTPLNILKSGKFVAISDELSVYENLLNIKLAIYE